MRWILTVLILSTLLVSGCIQATTDFYSCSQDSDCIKVDGGCCDCNNGGKATSINKNVQAEWDSKMTVECQGLNCLTVISDDLTCSQEPKCVGNKCVLK